MRLVQKHVVYVVFHSIKLQLPKLHIDTDNQKVSHFSNGFRIGKYMLFYSILTLHDEIAEKKIIIKTIQKYQMPSN